MMTALITADHITITDDTALVVAHHCEGDHPEGENRFCDLAYKSLNRPCDTCDGDGALVRAHDKVIVSCPACHGRKRHIFTVELEREWGALEPHPPLATPVRTLAVHVINVLPVVDWTDESCDESTSVEIRDDGSAWLYDDDYLRDVQCLTGPKPITLPPAAEPGMWLARLEVQT